MSELLAEIRRSVPLMEVFQRRGSTVCMLSVLNPHYKLYSTGFIPFTHVELLDDFVGPLEMPTINCHANFSPKNDDIVSLTYDGLASFPADCMKSILSFS